MSFRDLILRVAVEVGLSDDSSGVPAIPSDPGDLATVKRAVNDGIALFARANPQWRWMEPEVSLTLDQTGASSANIGGLTNEYSLPWYCQGAPITDWIITSADNGISGRLLTTSIDRVRDYLATYPESSGRPIMAAHVVWRPGDGTALDRPRWKVVLDRIPDSNYILTATFRVVNSALVELDDRHLAGAQHDQSIVDAGVWAYWRSKAEADPGVRQWASDRFDRALAESTRLDLRQRERVLGDMEDPSIDTSDVADAYWAGEVYARPPMYSNGVLIS